PPTSSRVNPPGRWIAGGACGRAAPRSAHPAVPQAPRTAMTRPPIAGRSRHHLTLEHTFVSVGAGYDIQVPRETKVRGSLSRALLQIREHLTRRVRSGSAGDPAAGMRSRTAEVERGQSQPISRVAEEGPPREELVERRLAVER